MMYPDLITLDAHNGDTTSFLNAVYDAYLTYLVRGRLTFLGTPIGFKFAPATDGRGFAFWHAVQERGETGAEDDRRIDLRRCERIGWPAFLLQNVTPAGRAGRVLWWKNRRGTATRVVIWLVEADYALILDERRHHHMFWTTYMVRSGRKKAFEKEHADYWARQVA